MRGENAEWVLRSAQGCGHGGSHRRGPGCGTWTEGTEGTQGTQRTMDRMDGQLGRRALFLCPSSMLSMLSMSSICQGRQGEWQRASWGAWHRHQADGPRHWQREERPAGSRRSRRRALVSHSWPRILASANAVRSISLLAVLVLKYRRFPAGSMVVLPSPATISWLSSPMLANKVRSREFMGSSSSLSPDICQ